MDTTEREDIGVKEMVTLPIPRIDSIAKRGSQKSMIKQMDGYHHHIWSQVTKVAKHRNSEDHSLSVTK